MEKISRLEMTVCVLAVIAFGWVLAEGVMWYLNFLSQAIAGISVIGL